MVKSTRVRLVSLLAFLLVMTALSPGRARADAQAGIQAELAKARQLWATRDYRNACKAYQRANELAQGKSAPSLIGLSACFTSLKEGTKAVEMARQARAVAATPEEQALATKTLGDDLLRQPDEASWTEAASVLKEQVASSEGAEVQGGLLSALLSLHRDQEAAEILQSLRKQSTAADEIPKILFYAAHSIPSDNPRRIDDFNEHLHRLDPETPLVGGGNKYREPKILHQVTPEATDEARWHPGFQGTVIVEGIIDEQGNIHDVKALKEQPYGLTEAAVKAVKAWTFQPGTIDGKPVRIYYVLSVNFKIQ